MKTLLVVSRTSVNAEALARALRDELPDYQVIASDVGDAKPLTRQHSPLVAVIELDVTSGLKLVRDLLLLRPAMKVFVYGVAEDQREQMAWAEVGVFCIVLRTVALNGLIRSVASATVADSPRSGAMKTALQRPLGMTRLQCTVEQRPLHLTPRELDVLRLISLGFSNREVAQTLGLELPTVKNHVQNVMKKLGVHRRADAAKHLSRSSPSGDPVSAGKHSRVLAGTVAQQAEPAQWVNEESDAA